MRFKSHSEITVTQWFMRLLYSRIDKALREITKNCVNILQVFELVRGVYRKTPHLIAGVLERIDLRSIGGMSIKIAGDGFYLV